MDYSSKEKILWMTINLRWKLKKGPWHRGQCKGFYDWSRDPQVGVEEGENEEEGEEEEECLTPVRQVYENPLDRCIVIRILGIFFL
jgi:hypothetical protein